MHYAYRGMKLFWVAICFFVATQVARAQIQVELKFKRLQYVAYEPVTAMLTITNLAGRDVDLHDLGTQRWFGFEVTGGEQQLLAPVSLQSETKTLPSGPLRNVTPMNHGSVEIAKSLPWLAT